MHIIDIVINTRLTLLRPTISFIVKFIDHTNISYVFIIQIPFIFLLLELLSIMVFSTIDLFRAKVYFVSYFDFIPKCNGNRSNPVTSMYLKISSSNYNAVDNNQLDLNEPHSKQGLIVYNNSLTVVCFYIYNMSLHLVSEFCYEFDGV